MSNKSLHNLKKTLLNAINEDILLTDDVMHYIDSTFSNPSTEALRQILSDPSNCESASIFELIFYPDLKIQEKIEAHLTPDGCDPADIETAIIWVSQKKQPVKILFPDERGVFFIIPTDSVIRQFIFRLHLCKNIDPRLMETLNRFIEDKADKIRIRVLWRNCRTQFSHQESDFLCACIEKMYLKSAFFWEVFAFLLNFFEYFQAGQDIYTGLMKEKKINIQSIQQWEKNEKALKKNSMEALMLQGVSFLSVNMEATRKKIMLIDHICISMFGKTEIYDESQICAPVITKNIAVDGLSNWMGFQKPD